MAQTVMVEVWVVVDEAGDYAVARDRDGLPEAYDADIGGDPYGSRIVRVVLEVLLSEAVSLAGTVPPESVEGLKLAIAG